MAKKTRVKAKIPKKLYFTSDTEDAIIEYNKTKCAIEKSKIFNEKIYTPLDKLTENLIHTYKFYYYETTYEDLKLDTIAFLHEKLEKFTMGRGKAFSFFTKVAWHYLLASNTRVYEQSKKMTDLDAVDSSRNVVNEVHRDDMTENLNVFMELWTEWNIANLSNIYRSGKERTIAAALLEIFRTRKSLDSFSKKYLYILIREQTDFNTSNITPVVNKMKTQFYSMYMEFLSGEFNFPAFGKKNKFQ